MRDLQKMIGENINQYTRFYPKTYPPHGIPTDCPQPLGRMLECSELTLDCSVELVTRLTTVIYQAL